MATCPASRAHRERLLYIVIPVLLMGLLADQASKSWASRRAVEPRILVPGYLAAYSVPNAGGILGLGRDGSRTATISALLGIACATLLVRIAYSDRGRWRAADCLAGALVLAGIFGNTLDRLALGHVRDFLVTWAIPTFVFNVADLLVVAGGACLLMARYGDHRRVRSEPGLLRRAAGG
jgi:lipoprotein signal peptidase